MTTHERGARAGQAAPGVTPERDRRILLWMPWKHDADTLARVLSQEGLPRTVCPTFEVLLDEAGRGAGALLLSEDVLHPEAAQPLRYLLDEQPPWSDLPVVLLCDGQSMAHAATQAHAILDGALPSLLEQPVPAQTLVSTLHAALRHRGQQYRVRDLHARLEYRVEERTRQVRRLVEALTLAEQQERKRIAQILHDDLQQVLYGLGMTLKALGNSTSSDDTAMLYDQAHQTLNLAIDTTRSLSTQLSPPVLHDGNLGQLLEWLALRKEDQYGLQVEIERSGPCQASDPDVLVLVYQFLRELLFNVSKHAGTDRALVKAHEDEACIILQVIDEGRGFDPDAVLEGPHDHGGFGLPSVQERLRLIGGHLTIDAAPGDGTRVTLTVPTHPDADAA